MKKILLLGSTVIICGSFLIVLGLVYLISPRTVNAVFFICQAWCCHYVASGLKTVGLDGHFEQIQQCAIDGYANARRNLDNADQLVALKQDEEAQLAYHYVLKGNYKAANPLLDHIEAESRSQLRNNFADKDSWLRFFAGILQTHANVLEAENKPAQALEKYRECLRVFEQLKQRNALDEVSAKAWAKAKAEVERLSRV